MGYAAGEPQFHEEIDLVRGRAYRPATRGPLAKRLWEQVSDPLREAKPPAAVDYSVISVYSVVESAFLVTGDPFSPTVTYTFLPPPPSGARS